MEADRAQTGGAAKCDSAKDSKADGAKTESAAKCDSAEADSAKTDGAAKCASAKTDTSKLNGDSDPDHVIPVKPPEEETIELTPSGRPRRKATIKTPSPAKVNGIVPDNKPRSSGSANAKKKMQARGEGAETIQNGGRTTPKRRQSGKETDSPAVSTPDSGSKEKKAETGLASAHPEKDNRVHSIDKDTLPSSSHQPNTTIVVSASLAGSSAVRGRNAGVVHLNLPIQSFAGVSAVSSALMRAPGVALATSSAPMFQAAMRNNMQTQGVSRNPSSLLLHPFSGMMSRQGNQPLPVTSFNNQGTRPPMTMTSILANMPEKPSSSQGMIEMIRWEVENHINIKPKYVRPNPKAELGNLAKWMFDLGSDIAKEFVYHELVTIQHRRNDDGTLTDKEKEDFVKLKEVDKELNNKVGHLKYRSSRSCKCGFRTELANVKYLHQQHAHIERGGMLHCPLCKYSVRQPNTFRFHMETEHGRAGIVENRPSFYECCLCPYETNYTNRLDQHKVRCQRNFKEGFNLHPSCVTGPEIDLCLENVFYYIFTNRFMNPTPRPGVPALTTKPIAPLNAMQAKKGANSRTPIGSNLSGPRMSGHFQQNAGAMGKAQQSTSRSMPAVLAKSKLAPNQVVAGAWAPGSQQTHRANQPNASKQPPLPNHGFEVCEICGGYVKDRKALRIHFFYAHRIDMPFSVFERPQAPLYCATCFARFWTAQGLQKHIEVHKKDSMTTSQTGNAVAGKCILCSHRVPNILLHMRMVHNREMNHYLLALMCIFCGCRFKTRREVENHILKMHSVPIRGLQGGAALPSLPAPSRNGPSQLVGASKSSSPRPGPASRTGLAPRTPGPASRTGLAPRPGPASRTGLSPRPGPASKTGLAPRPGPASRTGLTPRPGPASRTGQASQPSPASNSEGGRNKCVLCNVGFTRNVDLTRHCMRVHHTCMKCGLVVVDKESLTRHNCLPCASGMRTCHLCDEDGFHPAYYIKHMRDKHLRKCSIILRRLDQAIVETLNLKRPITISDSEDDEPSIKQPKQDIEQSAQVADSKVEVDLDSSKTKTDIVEQEKVEENGETQNNVKQGDKDMGEGEEKQSMSVQDAVKEKPCDALDGADQDTEGAADKNTNEEEANSSIEQDGNDASDKPACVSEVPGDGTSESRKRRLGSQGGDGHSDKQVLLNGTGEEHVAEHNHVLEESDKDVSSKKRKLDSAEGSLVRKSLRRSSSKGDDISAKD